MKAHLKKAVETFDQIKGRDYLINPISELDAEIIIELTEIFKKLGKTDLVSILDTYKYKKDEEIRDDLLQWNIDNGKLQDQKEQQSAIEEVFSIPSLWINIQDFNLNLADIFNYQKIEEWDDDYVRPVFGIIVNEIPENVTRNIPLYANRKFLFEYERERDEYYDLLDKYIKEKRNIEFIN